MIKTVVAILLITILFASFPTFALAQENTLNVEMKVDHVVNVIERFKEKMDLYFQFSDKKKVEYYQYLANKRLAEIAYATENENNDRVEETASRYQTNIGNLIQYVSTHNISDSKRELTNMSKNHILLLENLRDHYPANSGWWLAIQHDVNTAKMFSSKLNDLK